MIDILLNRQLEFGGVSPTQNGWVEPGNQVKQMKLYDEILSYL